MPEELQFCSEAVLAFSVRMQRPVINSSGIEKAVNLCSAAGNEDI